MVSRPSKSENKLTIRPSADLSFNPRTGEFTLANRTELHNVLLFDLVAWSHMVQEMERKFGTGSVVILQSAGEAAGSSSAKALAGVHNQEGEIRTIFSSVSKWGFGRYELVRFEPMRSIRFRLMNNIKMVAEGKNEVNRHHFLIGFYRGYFTTLFKSKVRCEEISCMNLGDRSCEFEVTAE